MRLIDANNLMDHACRDRLDSRELIWAMIENAPTIDAVPVVRCKDCIYCVKEPNGEVYCDILAVGYEPFCSKKVTDDWFCADGEQKKGK